MESKPLNISTRADARTGDQSLIGGFIIAGGNSTKRVMIRAIGPSLAEANPPVTGAMNDPILELHFPDGSVTTNDDWRLEQEAQIVETGIPPTNDKESAIITDLPPVLNGVGGAYTAVVRGKNNGTGVALIEVYDLDSADTTTFLANISTRGLVEAGDSSMIGGFIIGSGLRTGQVVVRAIGPSLTGLTGVLQDPTLTLFDSQGTPIAENDDWVIPDGSGVEGTGLAPSDSREAAILADLTPGAYTVLVQGKNGATGVGLVEVYYLFPD